MSETPQHKSEPPVKRNRRWKRWALPPIALILVLFAAVFLLTGTGAGLRLMVQFAKGPIAESVDGTFFADGVSGSLWSEVSIAELTFAMPDGLSVRGRNLRLSWHPSELFGRKLVVEAIGAERLSVVLPEGDEVEAPSEEEPVAFSIPRLPVRIVVRKLDFPSVAVSLPDGSQYGASLLGGVATTETGDIETTVDVAADLDGKPVDRVSLTGTVTAGDAPELSLSLSASIPPDGVLFAVLDLPPHQRRPLSVSVSGTGALAGWSGDVDIEAEGFAGIGGQLGLGLTDAGMSMSFDGALDFYDPRLFDLPQGLAGRYDIVVPDLSVVDETLAISDIQVTKEGLAAVSLSARMTLDATEVSADGTVAIVPGATALVDLPIDYRDARLTFDVSGFLPELRADLRMTVHDLEGFGNSLGTVEADVSAAGSLDDGVTVDALVEAKKAAWSDDALSQLLGETVTITAHAELDPSFQSIEGIEVFVGPLGASLQTALTIEGATVTADKVRAGLDDLSRLEPLMGLPIAGSGVINLSGLRVAEDGSVSTVFEIAAQDLAVIDDQTSQMIGRTPVLKGDILLSESDGLAVTLHDLRARAGAVSGVVLLSPDFQELSGSVNARAIVSALPADVGLTVDGGILDITARFAGPLAQPDLDANLAPFSGDASGTPLDLKALAAQLRWRNDAPFVTFQAAASTLGLDATVEGGAAMLEDGLDIPGISVTGTGWSAWAAAKLPGYSLPAEGSARVVVSDASPFTGLAGLYSLSGQANLEAQISKGAAADAQAVSISLSSERIAVATEANAAPINVERVALTADIGDVLALQDIDATVDVRNLAGDGFQISEIGATLRGTGETFEGEVSVTGADPTPIVFTSNVSGRLLENGQGEVHATDLRFGYASLKELAAGKADAAFGPDDSLSAALDLSILSGTLTAGYDRVDGAAELTLDASSIPVGPLAELQGESGVEGLINAKADLRQSVGATEGAFSLSATGLRTDDLDKEISVDVTVGGDVAGDRVRIEAKTAGSGLDRTSIQGALPLAVSLLEPGAALNPDGPLEGIVNAEIQLQEIWPYLPLPEHAVNGALTADIRVGGTPANPSVEGDAGIADGEYEHLVHGTLIRNIEGLVRFAGENFELESLAGQDPYGGSFQIAGKGSMAGGAPVFDIATKLSGLRVVNSDAVKADVDADISTRQQGDGMIIQGQALVRRAEVNLSVALPPSISTLDVEDGTALDPKAEEQTEPSRIALDLTVDAPGQIFVRGRGLESEWQGNVRVTGTANQPIVSGGLTARRGRIDVIGKSFTLDDSKIQFFGGETIDPTLGIRGEHEGDDITVIALLEGRASKPEITLTSEPSLPQDEVLSRLLFGKTASSLSPLEAAQLAASASELAGGGSGIDVLGTIRDFVGVDVLEVDTSGGDAAVKAGSYVADGVFVGAKQGAAPGSSSVTVEVEVTPNISVTTESGQTSSNAGVNFKWDY
ncbi:translocation/assembly module TamB domain-containing protein [Hwanghaeella sp.]|uniref:translocation/assembly module TamB domain-containing protein n=1 Tax=Hwanghaeella sp. TaxID=2605943 RepID=UPI003CCBDC0B